MVSDTTMLASVKTPIARAAGLLKIPLTVCAAGCSVEEERPAGVVAPSVMIGTAEEWQAYIGACVQRSYDARDFVTLALLEGSGNWPVN